MTFNLLNSLKKRYFALSCLFWGMHTLNAQISPASSESAYVQASSVVTQTPASGKGSFIKIDSIDYIKNFELSPEKDTLIAKINGVYLIIASLQIGATSPGARGYIDCWFVKNGKAVANSTVRQSIDLSTSAVLAITEFILPLSSGDTLGTVFTASGPSLGITFIKPDNEPAIPSFIFSIIKID